MRRALRRFLEAGAELPPWWVPAFVVGLVFVGTGSAWATGFCLALLLAEISKAPEELQDQADDLEELELRRAIASDRMAGRLERGELVVRELREGSGLFWIGSRAGLEELEAMHNDSRSGEPTQHNDHYTEPAGARAPTRETPDSPLLSSRSSSSWPRPSTSRPRNAFSCTTETGASRSSADA